MPTAAPSEWERILQTESLPSIFARCQGYRQSQQALKAKVRESLQENYKEVITASEAVIAMDAEIRKASAQTDEAMVRMQALAHSCQGIVNEDFRALAQNVRETKRVKALEEMRSATSVVQAKIDDQDYRGAIKYAQDNLKLAQENDPPIYASLRQLLREAFTKLIIQLRSIWGAAQSVDMADWWSNGEQLAANMCAAEFFSVLENVRFLETGIDSSRIVAFIHALDVLVECLATDEWFEAHDAQTDPSAEYERYAQGICSSILAGFSDRVRAVYLGRVAEHMNQPPTTRMAVYSLLSLKLLLDLWKIEDVIDSRQCPRLHAAYLSELQIFIEQFMARDSLEEFGFAKGNDCRWFTVVKLFVEFHCVIKRDETIFSHIHHTFEMFTRHALINLVFNLFSDSTFPLFVTLMDFADDVGRANLEYTFIDRISVLQSELAVVRDGFINQLAYHYIKLLWVGCILIAQKSHYRPATYDAEKLVIMSFPSKPNAQLEDYKPAIVANMLSYCQALTEQIAVYDQPLHKRTMSPRIALVESGTVSVDRKSASVFLNVLAALRTIQNKVKYDCVPNGWDIESYQTIIVQIYGHVRQDLITNLRTRCSSIMTEAFEDSTLARVPTTKLGCFESSLVEPVLAMLSEIGFRFVTESEMPLIHTGVLEYLVAKAPTPEQLVPKVRVRTLADIEKLANKAVPPKPQSEGDWQAAVACTIYLTSLKHVQITLPTNPAELFAYQTQVVWSVARLAKFVLSPDIRTTDVYPYLAGILFHLCGSNVVECARHILSS